MYTININNKSVGNTKKYYTIYNKIIYLYYKTIIKQQNVYSPSHQKKNHLTFFS